MKERIYTRGGEKVLNFISDESLVSEPTPPTLIIKFSVSFSLPLSFSSCLLPSIAATLLYKKKIEKKRERGRENSRKI